MVNIYYLTAVALSMGAVIFPLANAEANNSSSEILNERIDTPLVKPQATVEDKVFRSGMDPKTKYLLESRAQRGAEAYAIVSFSEEATKLDKQSEKSLKTAIANLAQKKMVHLSLEVVNKVTIGGSQLADGKTASEEINVFGSFYNSLPSTTQARADSVLNFIESHDVKISKASIDYIDVNEEILAEQQRQSEDTLTNVSEVSKEAVIKESLLRVFLTEGSLE